MSILWRCSLWLVCGFWQGEARDVVDHDDCRHVAVLKIRKI